MDLFLIRHGATAGNKEKRYVGRTDEGLQMEAVLQLQDQAGDIQRQAGSVAALVSSPMKRCLETAEILFPREIYPDIPRVEVEELKECDFGDFEYKNYEELSGDPRYQHFIDTWGKEGFPGGETSEMFKKRTVTAFCRMMEDISSRIDMKKKQTLVLLVHGGTIMAVMEAFSEEKRDYYGWQIGNGEGFFGTWDETEKKIRHAKRIQKGRL